MDGYHATHVNYGDNVTENTPSAEKREEAVVNRILRIINDENLLSYEAASIERIMNYHKIPKSDQSIMLKHCRDFTDIELS
jgi:hypothetical protein